MRRAFFLGVVMACGGAREPAHVDIAAPLPPVSAAASAEPLPAAPKISVSRDVGDPRPAPTRPASVLESEAKSLEALIASTATSSPDAPMLLFRAAETYAELRKLGGEPSASTKAIDRYKVLTSQYPSFAKIDEAYLGLGLEYVARDDAMNARRAFYELIKNTPQSRYVPYAYFAFGDMFQREAKSDPTKLEFAQQAYFEVRKYPPSPIVAEAICRLSQVVVARGEPSKADALRAELARDYPSSDTARRCAP